MNDNQNTKNEDIRPQDGTKNTNDNQKLDKISQKEKPERKSKGL